MMLLFLWINVRLPCAACVSAGGRGVYGCLILITVKNKETEEATERTNEKTALFFSLQITPSHFPSIC